MSDRIYLSPPEVTGQDRELLLAAIDSNWIAPTGPDLVAFEAEVADRCDRAHAVGLTSGTAALHLALLEMGVRPGDEVVLPTLNFVAGANAVRYCGADPVFVDVSPADWQLSPGLTHAAIEERRAAGARVAAVIAVDLYGQCAAYDELAPMLAELDVPLLSDAAESLGATLDGRPAGSFGLHAAVSFNGNKIITTSGGGMLLTDDEEAADHARKLAAQAREPVDHYEHQEMGFNYRLSNLLAAFGRGQLADLDRRIVAKERIRRRYIDALADMPGVSFMPVAPTSRPNAWLTCLLLGANREPTDVIAALEAADIEARRIWKPLHLQPLYRRAATRLDGTAEAIFDRGICLPSGSGLAEEQQDRVIELLAGQLGGGNASTRRRP